MADPNYFLCDICGEPVPKECRFSLVVGESPDPSGNGYLCDFRPVDLCHEHAIEALTWATGECGRPLFEWVRKQERPV